MCHNVLAICSSAQEPSLSGLPAPTLPTRRVSRHRSAGHPAFPHATCVTNTLTKAPECRSLLSYQNLVTVGRTIQEPYMTAPWYLSFVQEAPLFWDPHNTRQQPAPSSVTGGSAAAPAEPRQLASTGSSHAQEQCQAHWKAASLTELGKQGLNCCRLASTRPIQGHYSPLPICIQLLKPPSTLRCSSCALT